MSSNNSNKNHGPTNGVVVPTTAHGSENNIHTIHAAKRVKILSDDYTDGDNDIPNNKHAGDAAASRLSHASLISSAVYQSHAPLCQPITPNANTNHKNNIQTPHIVRPTTATNSPRTLSKAAIRRLLHDEANYDCDTPGKTQKRSDYLAWDDYFMAVASLSSKRSKDPTFPTGACIVDQENRIVGIGYNGLPRGCSDDCLPWTLNGNSLSSNNSTDNDRTQISIPFLHTRDPYVCHAEVNAILNKCSANVDGARMYVEHFPCNECAKVIIQSKISKVIYMQDNRNDDAYRASRILFGMAGVETIHYTPTLPKVTLDFHSSLPAAAANIPCCSTICNSPQRPDAKIDSSSSSRKHRYKDLLMKEAGYDPTKMLSTKRHDYLSWGDYFMAIAFLTAKRSKDPNTQVGACIIDTDSKKIIAVGYNGFPRGCSDDDLPWSRDAQLPDLHKKYHYVCHAEVNAILNKGSADVRGATLYVALFPCHDCAKVIIQSGIQTIVYLSDQYHDMDSARASRILFQMAGVTMMQHVPKNEEKWQPIDIFLEPQAQPQVDD